MLKFHKSDHPWGQFVDAKINLPDVLVREAKKACGKKILFSSVTDCYQPVEAEFGITRECLKILSDHNCSVSILTKSALATREADLVSKFQSFTFGMSASYHDDSIRKNFETGTSTIAQRAQALKTMKEAGAKTWLFVSPYLPGITQLEPLLKIFAGCAASFSVEAINLYTSTLKGLSASVASSGHDFQKLKEQARNPYFWEQAKIDAQVLGKKTGLKLDEFYFHNGS
jgi:DNA repair photolyase